MDPLKQTAETMATLMLNFLRESQAALTPSNASIQVGDYPLVLEAKHVSEILNVSKSKAYEVMRMSSFPLIQMDGRMLVYRDSFFKWLMSQEKISS